MPSYKRQVTSGFRGHVDDLSETPPTLFEDLPFLHGLVQLAVVRLGYQAVADGFDDVQGHESVRGSNDLVEYYLNI